MKRLDLLRATRAVVLFAFSSAVLLGACGAPDGGPTTTITEVPYGLQRPADTATSSPTHEARFRPFIYLVDDQVLVPVEASPPDPADTAGTLGAVLGQLSKGPTETDRSAGLSTALGPDTAIKLVQLQGGVAHIDVSAGDQVPSPPRVPLAVGQIVLTATSVPDVEAVLMTRDGAPVQLPIPVGALTSDPVTAQDYAELTRP
jgi:spore germination protein GerM